MFAPCVSKGGVMPGNSLAGELERLKTLQGQGVWYYDRNSPMGWKRAVVTEIGAKDGYPVVDVRLANGVELWGYGWQIASGDAAPPPPDLSKSYP